MADLPFSTFFKQILSLLIISDSAEMCQSCFHPGTNFLFSLKFDLLILYLINPTLLFHNTEKKERICAAFSLIMIVHQHACC